MASTSFSVQIKALLLISLLAGDCVAAAASKPIFPLLAVTLAAHQASSFRHVMQEDDVSLDLGAIDGTGRHHHSRARQTESLAALTQHEGRLLETAEMKGFGNWVTDFFTSKETKASRQTLGDSSTVVDFIAQGTDNTNNMVGAFVTASVGVGETLPVIGIILGVGSVAKTTYDIKRLKKKMQEETNQTQIKLRRCMIWNKKKDAVIAVISTGVASCAAVGAFAAPATLGASAGLVVGGAAIGGAAVLAVSVGNFIHNIKYSCRKIKAYIEEEHDAMLAHMQMAALANAKSANRYMMKQEAIQKAAAKAAEETLTARFNAFWTAGVTFLANFQSGWDGYFAVDGDGDTEDTEEEFPTCPDV